MPSLTLPSLAAGLALLVAGCGAGQAAPPADPGGGGPAVAVAMKEIAFVPGDVRARVGQTVRWTNTDPVRHDVTTIGEGDGPRSQLLDGGQTYSFTPRRPGRISYVCTIHPTMRGTITVTR